MLGKLFKYDMRQISKIMLPFMILVFGTTILGSAALKIGREVSASFTSNIITNTFCVSLFCLFGISVLALFAYAVMAVFLSVSRYYKHLFTDEGYLTFTLPVKSSTLIFSKLWATLLWFLLSVAVVIACIFVYVTFGGAPLGKFMNTEFYDGLWYVVWSGLKLLFSGLPVSYLFNVIETFALGLASLVYSILTMFLAITIGSLIAKKHKILASIGIYYAINTALSTATTVLMTVFMFGFSDMYDIFAETTINAFSHVLPISMFCLYAGALVAEFLFINHLLKKKLNLQ